MEREQTIAEVRYRGRINWGRTAKEGWRLNDMTIEIINMTPETFDVARGHATTLAIELYQDGCEEADRRNERERGLVDAA